MISFCSWAEQLFLTDPELVCSLWKQSVTSHAERYDRYPRDFQGREMQTSVAVRDGVESETSAGAGRCRARAVTELKKPAIGYSIGGNAREGKKGIVRCGEALLVVRSRHQAHTIFSILQFAMPHSHQELQVWATRLRGPGHAPLFMAAESTVAKKGGRVSACSG